MKTRWIPKPIPWCAALLLAAGIVGCSPTSHPPAASSPSVRVAPVSSTTSPVSTDNACAQAQFSSQQFTGDWTEPGETTVTTLDPDGVLRFRGGNNQSGTWSYEPWGLTPAKDHMPAGEDNHCVLWLHWTNPGPPLDLVYVPLKVGGTSIQLSYVGRGNTVTWVRPTASG